VERTTPNGVKSSNLHVTQDFDVVVLDMTEEQLEAAPQVDRGDKKQMLDPKWREQTNQYYEK
jgi:hypothetical protein